MVGGAGGGARGAAGCDSANRHGFGAAGLPYPPSTSASLFATGTGRLQERLQLKRYLAIYSLGPFIKGS